MNDFDFRGFYNNIQKDFLDINVLIDGVEPFYWQAMHQGGKPGEFDDYGEYDFNIERLVGAFQLMRLKFSFAHEYLHLDRLAQ